MRLVLFLAGLAMGSAVAVIAGQWSLGKVTLEGGRTTTVGLTHDDELLFSNECAVSVLALQGLEIGDSATVSGHWQPRMGPVGIKRIGKRTYRLTLWSAP